MYRLHYRGQGVQATVRAAALVDHTGLLVEARIRESSGDPAADEKALELIRGIVLSTPDSALI